MSYNILQKNIDEKLKKYKQKVGKYYYTYYYYEALDLLDKYILDLANNQKTKSKFRISELLSKANKLQEDKYIFRNYILSLFIENNNEKLKDIFDENIEFYQQEDIYDEEKAIYFFIDGFLNEEEFENESKLNRFKLVYEDLNYIDYRILYVLYKKYNIDVFEKAENYLIDSYENKYINKKDGRKTLKARLAYYCVLESDDIEQKFDNILKDIQYLDGVKSVLFNNRIIKQIGQRFYSKNKITFLKDEINSHNIVVYEYLLQLLNVDLYKQYKDMFDYIIEKYCAYRRFNLTFNKDKIDLISSLLNYNEELSLLACFNNANTRYLESTKKLKNKKINFKKEEVYEKTCTLDQKLKQELKKNTYFTDKELMLIKELDDEYLNIIINNLYCVEICDMKNIKCKIIFKFKNYPEGNIVYYDKNAFYYLPEEPIEIIILKDEVLYGKAFTITKANSIDNFGFKNIYKDNLTENYKRFKESLAKHFYKNALKIKLELLDNKLSYKFSLYILYSNIDDLIRNLSKNNLKFNKSMVELLIQYKSIFSDKTKYYTILDKIRNSIKKDLYADESKEIVRLISEELNDTMQKQKNLYEIMNSIKDNGKIQLSKDFDLKKEKTFEDIVDDIIELDVMDVSIQYPVFTDLVKIAYENNYYDNMSFVNICEKFIYKNKLVDKIVYKYMQECYKRTYLLTDKTDEILKIINLYYDTGDNKENNLEMTLNYWIKLNRYDDKFIATFKKLCKSIPSNELAYNQVVKKSINFMTNLNNYNKYIDDLDIIRIMEDVYLNTNDYYKCLEAIIYRYIKNNKIDKIKEYVNDIVLYYTKEKIITDCCIPIVKTIYDYKYYEQLEKNTITEFKRYFVEILKYEILEYSYYSDLVKNDIILIKNNNNNVIYKFDKASKDNILIKLDYNESYKINDKDIERSYLIKNKEIFINEFEYGDDLFKKKAFNLMKEKNIYKREIVVFGLKHESILKDKLEYKDLYMTYLLEEVDFCQYSFLNYIKQFKYFINKCGLSKEDNKNIEIILKNIGSKEKDYELDLFKTIDKKFGEFEFSDDYIEYIIKQYNSIDEDQYFIEYFDLNKTRLNQTQISEAFKYYFKSLKYINEKCYKNIMSILSYVIKLDINNIRESVLNCIIDTILDKDFYRNTHDDLSQNVRRYSILASLHILVHINTVYSYKDKEIYKKVKETYIYISDFYSRKEHLNSFLIRKFNGNLQQLRELCDFIIENSRSYNFTIDEEKIIIKKAHYLFDIEVKKEIEKASSKIYICKRDSFRQNIVNDYKNIVSNLRNEKVTDKYYRNLMEMDSKQLINDLVVSKTLDFNNIIQRYIGFELNNMDDKLLILKIQNKNLYKIIKRYLQDDDLNDLYFKDQENGFEYNVVVIKFMDTLDINNDKFNKNIDYLFNLFMEYIKFESDLLEENFIIPNLTSKNTILLQNKLFVANIHQVEVLDIINKHDLENNIHKNIQITADYMLKILNQSKLDKKDVYMSKLKNDLTNSNIYTLNQFYYKLKSIKDEIINAENLVISRDNIFTAINLYKSNLLYKNQIDELVKIIVSQEVEGEEAYNIVLENINDYEIGIEKDIYKYLIKNYKLHGKKDKISAQSILAYLTDILYTEELNYKEIQSFEVFIKYLNQNNLINKHDYNKIIKKFKELENTSFIRQS